MENTNLNESCDWVDRQLASLHPPLEYQPDSAAALMQLHRRFEDHRPRTLWRHWPTWVTAAVLLIVIVLLLPTGRVAARQLLQFLTVRRVAVVRVGSWPGEVPSPQVKLIGTVIPPIPARDLDEARRRIHYLPRWPRSGVGSAAPRWSTTFSMAAGMVVQRADLALALQKAGITDQAVPRQWDGAQLALHTSAMALAEWPEVALAQSLPLTLTAPAGFDFPAFSAVILRILGIEPGEAQRLARQMGTAPPWLAPLDRHYFERRATIEQIVLASGPATLVQEQGSSGVIWRTSLFWSVPDRVYLLSGKLSRDRTILIANSMQ